MREILEKVRNEIDTIKQEEQHLEKLTKSCNKLLQEEGELTEQRDEIGDVNSGFYQDIDQKVKEKHSEYITENNKRMNDEKKLKELIIKKKEEIKNQIADKKHYIDENRNVNFDDLKVEKERLQKEIQLNDITREEFDTKTAAEKKQIKRAKEDYLNNKHRLSEINELESILDGKTPRERFMELDSLDKQIDANFNKENFNVILEEIDKEDKEKIERQQLLDDMVKGREQREEERYYEDIKSGLEETSRREIKELLDDMVEGREQREEERYYEDIKSGLEETKKRLINEYLDEVDPPQTPPQTPPANKDYKITIGREGGVEYNGYVYLVYAKDIKYGLGLNSIDNEDLEDYLRATVGIEDADLIKFVQKMVKTGKMDMTVIHSIYSTDMEEEDKTLVFKQYLSKVRASEYKRDDKSKVDITYDMKDLCRTNFFGRLFKREVNTDEKIKIYDNAIKAEKNGIGKIEGKYKTSLLEKFLNFWNKGDAITRLPIHHRVEEIEEVAYAYNEMGFDENGKKVTNKELQRAFKERLHSDAQLDDEDKNKFSESQREELRDLVEEHEETILTEEEENEI